jgi:hypothetical protein
VIPEFSQRFGSARCAISPITQYNKRLEWRGKRTRFLKPIYKPILLVIPLLLVSLAACEDEGRRPAKIYIPDGYVGWVRIEYGVANAPRLKTDTFGPWEYQRFPPSGLLQTSSILKNGAASADSYYYREDGSLKELPRNMQHGGIISWCVAKPDGSRLEREFITYFIGPEAEYEKHKNELEQFHKGDCRYVVNSLEDLPKVGSVLVR